MKFIIDTDLNDVNLMIDGSQPEEKIFSISLFADAPNKKYEDSGYIGLNVTTFDNDGNVKRTAYSMRKDLAENYKPLGVEDLKQNDIIRYIGSEINLEKKKLVDSIIQYCVKNNIKCPSEDTLLSRTSESLHDKLTDLGVTIDDTE